MYTFLSVVYVLVCVFLVLVVLLQPGRGGIGGAFGGGSSQTVFGSSGAGNFLTRLTSISAALFMILSATLAYMSSSSDKSLDRAAEAARAKAALRAKAEEEKKASAGGDAGALLYEESDEGAGALDAPGDEPAGEQAPSEAPATGAAAPATLDQPSTAAPQDEAPVRNPATTRPRAPTLERVTPPPSPRSEPANQPAAPVAPTDPNE